MKARQGEGQGLVRKGALVQGIGSQHVRDHSGCVLPGVPVGRVVGTDVTLLGRAGTWTQPSTPC